MKYSEKMTRNVCFAALTILMLLIKTSGGAILSTSSVSPTCPGSNLMKTEPDKSGTLSFRYFGSTFCKWRVEKQRDAGKAVVLHVKQIDFQGCPSNLQLPGTAKMCTRTKPFCHVYTSSDSYCTPSDVNQQVQASYSDCTTSQIHSGLTSMDIDYSPSGSNIKKFKIDYMRITCNKPPTTISSSSATTAEISTTNKAPISSRIIIATPTTTTTKANLGNDMMKAGQPVVIVVPTSGAEYLITSGAKTTKASETTRATSNNMETVSGSTGAAFSGIATSTTNISSITDDEDPDNITNMFTTGSDVTPGNGSVTPGNGTVTPGNSTVTPGNGTVTAGNATADAEKTPLGDGESKGHVNLVAMLTPIFVILAAVGCSGAIYIIWRRRKKAHSNN